MMEGRAHGITSVKSALRDAREHVQKAVSAILDVIE